MTDQEIIQLSDRDHILQRSQMYLGSKDFVKTEDFLLEDGKIQKRPLSYVPGLIKIINEILDNSIDEAVRTEFKFANKIWVDIEDSKISVRDNGRGIPVKKSPGSDEYMPVLAYCHARTGSNFSDTNRKTIGTNGLGSVITNIFSKSFRAETSDGKNRLTLECRDNLSYKKVSVHKNSSKFTYVEFEPDLERFNLSEVDDTHKNIIYQRILFLSMAFPQIKFYYNKTRVNIPNSKSFMELFSDVFEIFNGENWFIGVFPNDQEDFSFFSYVNGLNLHRGGNHIDLISNDITYKLREILIKKYKTIKPGDIKNKLSVVVFFNDFPNMKFDSQTKETLTNSTSEIRDYLKLSSEDMEKMAKKISKNEALIEPIVELFKLKEEFKKRQELKKLSKSKKKRIVSDSYYPPVGKNRYLFLTEGQSATGSISRVLGRKDIAYYSLRGKPLNTYNVKTQKLVKNREFKEIVEVLDMDLLDKNTDLNFEKVIILADQDSDGIHIRSLLLTFFNKFAPKALEEGRIGFMNTPLIIAFDKKMDPKYWFFSLNEYYNFSKEKLKGLELKYYKGLGSFNKEDLQMVIKKIGVMEDLFVSFKKTDACEHSLHQWMSSDSAADRKEFLFGREFNVSSI
jgi:DNA gyrase/topoisomerase IV subunit B